MNETTFDLYDETIEGLRSQAAEHLRATFGETVARTAHLVITKLPLADDDHDENLLHAEVTARWSKCTIETSFEVTGPTRQALLDAITTTMTAFTDGITDLPDELLIDTHPYTVQADNGIVLWGAKVYATWRDG